MNIRKQILTELDNAEKEHNIKIPIAIESGSRSWGGSSSDSDYDCRFIYVRKIESYLSIYNSKDTIEHMLDDVFDIVGWDLKKVIQHIVKSRAVVMEWISSHVTYKMDDSICRNLNELAEYFFNPVAVCWHYINLAKRKLIEIESSEKAKLKKYFYVLRPLACARFIIENNKFPFMDYNTNIANISYSIDLYDKINSMMELKKSVDESFIVSKDDFILNFFKTEIEFITNWLNSQKFNKKLDYHLADEYFIKIIREVNE